MVAIRVTVFAFTIAEVHVDQYVVLPSTVESDKLCCITPQPLLNYDHPKYPETTRPCGMIKPVSMDVKQEVLL